ncbi:hypothetical protein, partial [Nocardia cyriacigeorgica]|uniref:hypothetical protein n=1 Tax=Nocardia cyriacigeorgica TaxID=135487 RepID=UPI0013D1ADFD
ARSRIAAVLERFGGIPAVLLSGGVDSIYVAAVAVALGAEPPHHIARKLDHIGAAEPDHVMT